MDTADLSASLRSVVAALHKRLRKQTYSANTYSMTEIETIGLLNRNPSLLPSELATLTRVKTQSMSQILKKMEEQGIVRRTPSGTDKRKVCISLTAAGKKMVRHSQYERDELLRDLIERSLTEKEKEVLTRALPVLNKILETE